MRVSTKGDYASRALLSLAIKGNSKPVTILELSESTSLPQPYLAQIFLALKGAGLVKAKRGEGGGYLLSRPPEEIYLSQIISSVDGPITAGDFSQPHTDGACDHEGQCVLLAIWGQAGAQMKNFLDSFTLADLVSISKGKSAWPK